MGGLGPSLAIRLGYRYARGVGEAALARLDAAAAAGPYASLEEFCRRTQLEREAVGNLIAVGAFDCLGVPRRQLLWQLPEAIQAARDGELPGLRMLGRQVDLPPLAPIEEARSDYFVLGLSTAYHVMDFFRRHLDGRQALRCDELPARPSGRWVRVAGVVICRQAPPTARGHVFLTLEDETGLCNVTIRPNVYQTYRRAVRHDMVVLVEGVLQSQDGAVSVLARRLEGLRLDDLEPPPAREFR
jgi:error-prone DNA polymerase